LAVKNAKETLHDRRRKKFEVQKKTEEGGEKMSATYASVVLAHGKRKAKAKVQRNVTCFFLPASRGVLFSPHHYLLRLRRYEPKVLTRA
jgi:hypothetical protein